MKNVENPKHNMTPVYDAKGKKLAEMSTDKKRLVIAKQGRKIELFVNNQGELEQIEH
ncbi:MAG: hypothetical protein ACI4RR_03120 [Eubacterium sp.]